MQNAGQNVNGFQNSGALMEIFEDFESEDSETCHLKLSKERLHHRDAYMLSVQAMQHQKGGAPSMTEGIDHESNHNQDHNQNLIVQSLTIDMDSDMEDAMERNAIYIPQIKTRRRCTDCDRNIIA